MREPDATLYTILCDLADEEKVTPTNAMLGAMLGKVNPDQVRFALNRLRDAGLILIDKKSGSRSITVASTGKSTSMGRISEVDMAEAGRKAGAMATGLGDAAFRSMLSASGRRFEDSPAACRPERPFRMSRPLAHSASGVSTIYER